jgi:transposase InsO family protein
MLSTSLNPFPPDRLTPLDGGWVDKITHIRKWNHKRLHGAANNLPPAEF